MSAVVAPFRGVVRGGVIVPDVPLPLAEGTEVEVVPARLEFTPEERAEFEAWDRLSDEAFQMILDLEKQERDARG